MLINQDLADSSDQDVNDLILNYINVRDTTIPRCNCNPHGRRCFNTTCIESGVYTKLDHEILTLDTIIGNFHSINENLLIKIGLIKSQISLDQDNLSNYDDLDRLSMVLKESSHFITLMKIDLA